MTRGVEVQWERTLKTILQTVLNDLVPVIEKALNLPEVLEVAGPVQAQLQPQPIRDQLVVHNHLVQTMLQPPLDPPLEAPKDHYIQAGFFRDTYFPIRDGSSLDYFLETFLLLNFLVFILPAHLPKDLGFYRQNVFDLSPKIFRKRQNCKLPR